MCGIAGFELVPGEPPDPRAQVLLERLGRRGPDATGTGEHAGHCLVQTRLAIIDLDPRVTYPMGNEDGDVWLVFNGEIYDHDLLRTELERHGHRFATSCDAEVVIHAWEQWGTDCFSRLHGMFALAIADERSGDLVLARDRCGIKPLVRSTGRRLAFASDALALVAAGLSDGRPDAAAVREHLAMHVVGAPMTGVEDLADVMPGSWVRRGATAQSRARRSLPSIPAARLPAPPSRWASSTTRCASPCAANSSPTCRSACFSPAGSTPRSCSPTPPSSARDRAPSLSASPASATTTSAPRRRRSRRAWAWRTSTWSWRCPSPTPCSGTPAPSTGPSPIRLRSRCSASRGWRAARSPSRSAGPAATSCSRATTATAPTACGARDSSCRPRPPPRAARSGGSRRTATALFAGYVARLAAAGASDDAAQYLALLTQGQDDVLSASLREAIDVPGAAAAFARRSGLRRRPHSTPTRDFGGHDARSYLPADLLVKEDRSTMAYGLEARVPLLDDAVLAIALRMPDSQKHGLRAGKLPLREIAARRLPAGVHRGRKRGFAVPLGPLLAGPWRAEAQSWLLDSPSEWVDGGRAAAQLDRAPLPAAGVWSLVALVAWEQELAAARAYVSRMNAAGGLAR